MRAFFLESLVIVSGLGLFACASAPAHQDQGARFSPPPPWTGNVTFLLGGRGLDDGFWAPVEDQVALGLEADFQAPRSPLGLELGLQTSHGYDDVASGLDVEATMVEFYVGPRLTVEVGDVVRPYVGAGATFLATEFDAISGFSRISDRDQSVAGYAHGGINFGVTHAFNVGFDVRGVFGSDVELFGVAGDADYLQFALTAGVHW